MQYGFYLIIKCFFTCQGKFTIYRKPMRNSLQSESFFCRVPDLSCTTGEFQRDSFFKTNQTFSETCLSSLEQIFGQERGQWLRPPHGGSMQPPPWLGSNFYSPRVFWGCSWESEAASGSSRVQVPAATPDPAHQPHPRGEHPYRSLWIPVGVPLGPAGRWSKGMSTLCPSGSPS